MDGRRNGGLDFVVAVVNVASSDRSRELTLVREPQCPESLMVRRQRPTTAAESEVTPPLESEVTPLTLSLGNVAGPKLTRGVYVLAFREEESDSMSSNWNRFTLVHSDDGYYLSGATFSYLILNVDYADAPAPSDRRRAAH